MGLSAGEFVFWGSYVDINGLQEERIKKSLKFFIKTLFTLNVFAEAYLEPCQISKMETFAKIVNGLKPKIVFAKYSILDV